MYVTNSLSFIQQYMSILRMAPSVSMQVSIAKVFNLQ